MKKKEVIKGGSPMEMVFSTMKMIALGGNSARKEPLTDEWDNIIVDTCEAADTYFWETGIKRDSKSWVIVEQYENEVKAKEGHDGWVTLLKKNPDEEIFDIDIFGLEE